MRIIDADVLEPDMNKNEAGEYTAYSKEQIENARTLSTRIQKKFSHWVELKRTYDIEIQCAACNYILPRAVFYDIPQYRYCPNCGAQMNIHKE